MLSWNSQSAFLWLWLLWWLASKCSQMIKSRHLCSGLEDISKLASTYLRFKKDISRSRKCTYSNWQKKKINVKKKRLGLRSEEHWELSKILTARCPRQALSPVGQDIEQGIAYFRRQQQRSWKVRPMDHKPRQNAEPAVTRWSARASQK